jgi:hypothetical protein
MAAFGYETVDLREVHFIVASLQLTNFNAFLNYIIYVAQTQFLMDIALRFQEIATFATSADYRRTDFFSKDETLRLATATVNRGEVFSSAMALSGHDFRFRDSEDIEKTRERRPPYPPPQLGCQRKLTNRHEKSLLLSPLSYVTKFGLIH